MLFNSIEFSVFFIFVFAVYWFVLGKNHKAQNLFLLLSSYFFYACWDWRFLGLIFFSTLFNYTIGKIIGEKGKEAKSILYFGVTVNLLILGYFKYLNFFIESFASIFNIFGQKFNISSLYIILPIGISFYTFQSIAYLVDIHRKEVKSEKKLLDFSLFIAFFPQLVAGPIERAQNLLSQINKKREFSYASASEGCRLILLGLFEKMVIADNCARIVNFTYGDIENQSGSNLFLAAIYFSFQLYGDFSGYSHIAIGCSKLLGFELMKNFNFPYLAKNMADFWRRWHISFSSWLKDYVYFPLGGSKFGEFRMIRNLLVVFLLSGLWHGASYNFIIYGFIQAVLYISLIYYRKFTRSGIKPSNSEHYNWSDFFSILGTFVSLTLARIFFRSQSLSEALSFFNGLFSKSLFTIPTISKGLFLGLIIFIILEWIQRNRNHLFDFPHILSRNKRYAIYFCIIFMIFFFSGEQKSFIYFQF